MRRIYYTAVDNGDGSLGVKFFDTDCVAKLDSADPEAYRGEGGSWFELPDNTEVNNLTIITEAEVNELLSVTAE